MGVINLERDYPLTRENRDSLESFHGTHTPTTLRRAVRRAMRFWPGLLPKFVRVRENTDDDMCEYWDSMVYAYSLRPDEIEDADRLSDFYEKLAEQWAHDEEA